MLWRELLKDAFLSTTKTVHRYLRNNGGLVVLLLLCSRILLNDFCVVSQDYIMLYISLLTMGSQSTGNNSY